MKRQHERLTGRILLLVAGVIFALSISFFVFHTLHIRSLLSERRMSTGLSLATALSRGIWQGIAAKDQVYLKNHIVVVMADPQVIFAAVYDANGKLIEQQSRMKTDLSLSSDMASEFLNLPGPAATRKMVIEGEKIYEFCAPVRDAGRASGASPVGLVRIGLSRADVAAAELKNLEISSAIAATILGLGIVTSIFFSRRITRPLAVLKSGAKSISDGNMDVELSVTSEDEIGDLARAFNSMAQALRETTVSRDYVDNIMGSMNEALVVITPERRIATTNRFTQKLLGFTPAELEGSPIDTIIPSGEDSDFSTGDWPTFSAGSGTSNIEARLQTKGGKTIPVTMSAAPMLDRSGGMHGVVLIARDMRETIAFLKQLKSRTAELENYQRALLTMLDENQRAKGVAVAERQKTIAAVNSMMEGVVMFDPDGAAILVNPSAKRTLGIGDDEKTGSSDISAALGIDLGAFFDRAKDRPEERFSYDIVLPGAQKHVIRVEGTPVESECSRVGYMLILRDITRERRLDDAKSKLLANVSHELRTPLASINNTISNALAGVVGEMSEELRSHLNICHSNVQRLSGIIDNLLDVASLDSGRSRLSRSPSDIVLLVNGACNTVKAEIEKKGILFKVSLPDAAINAYCDPDAMVQVVGNLLDNAMRFTSSGGTIAVTVDEKDGQVEVAVTDSGVGIPIDEQRLIFGGFHQVGRTYGPGRKGLGLGLPISMRLIEMHGGSMGVSSTPGAGSRFYFRLPISSGEDLIASYIRDQLDALDDTGATPHLWVFHPTCDGKDAKILKYACHDIENKVGEVLRNKNHIVSIAKDGSSVLAAAALKDGSDAPDVMRDFKSRIGHLSFQIDGRIITCDVKIGHAPCEGDEDKTPEDFLAAAREDSEMG